MLQLEWNALRTGDQVLVHDDTTRDFLLRPAVVAVVGRHRNDVTVRVARQGAPTDLIRPRRLAVHLMPLDGAEPCWRCDAGAAGDQTEPAS